MKVPVFRCFDTPPRVFGGEACGVGLFLVECCAGRLYRSVGETVPWTTVVPR